MHLKLLLTSAVCGAKVDDDAKIFMVAAIAVIIFIVKSHFVPPLNVVATRIDLTSTDWLR